MSPQSPSGGPRLVQCPSPEYFYAAPPGMVLPPPPTAGSPMHLQEHPVVPLEPRPMSARGFSSDYEEEMASRGGSSSRAGRGFRYDSDGGYAAEYDDYDEYEDEEGRRHRRSRQSTADIIASQSQEYVDEKLAEYQATIHQLQDEQERVQKKTFVNWINSYLSKRIPPLRIDDLIEDLKDGTKLLALLEVLSGEKLPVERGRNLKRPHFLSNANTALQFLQSKKIKLVNINSTDLVDGRPPVVLGLIWTIILYFQIEENTRALESLGHRFGGSASSIESSGARSAEGQAKRSEEKRKTGARRALLQWVQNAIPQNLGIEVRDFGASWRDGQAFLAIIDCIKKNLIEIESLAHSTNRIRLETAFDVAEKRLGIARLLDPEDVDVPNPDEKSIMTYVAQFLHKYPEPGSMDETDSFSIIQNEYSDLISWLLKKTQYLEHLQQTETLSMNFKDFLEFRSEYDERNEVHERLRKLVDSQTMVGITPESWKDTERLWLKLESQMRYWLWLLDTRLPGAFSQVGAWLNQAENLITNDEIPSVMNEETASLIRTKLEEHKLFFAGLPNIQSQFEEARSAPMPPDVLPEQVEYMAERLRRIVPKAAQRRIRLKFLEHKCCLVAFLHLTEMKLRSWSGKYGREEKVQQLLDQYRNFVTRNKVFQSINKAYVDMQQVVEEYKRDGNIGPSECVTVDRFMRETGEKWQNVSMELRCVQNMLEEVVAYWRRWNGMSDEFESWLDRSYGMLELPEEDKMEYFQDLSVWKDRYQLIGDTVSFLLASCEDRVSQDLRTRFELMTSRWEGLFQHVKQYMHAGDILRNRKDYRAGLDRLQTWLRSAEETLSSSQLSSTESIKAYGDHLQRLQGEVEGMEELFKSVSKKFQNLIQDLSRDDVEKMMNTLKKEKEALVKVRALIPMQLHFFHQILVHQESLEAGQKEIGGWLDEAEELLSSHSLDVVGKEAAIQSQLDRHRAFFSRLPYYKSMLDSKNKIFHSIIKSTSGVSIDTGEFQHRMTHLNERFSEVAQASVQWEQRMMEAVRCWHNFNESERVISEWLMNAEKMISEKHIDNRNTVESHKAFFERVNEKWIQDLINSGQDLMKCLPTQHHLPIRQCIERLQAKWQEILSFAPLHLMRLEFRLDEAAFHQYLKEIDKEINSELQAFNKNENIESILNRNKAFFTNNTLIRDVEKSLETMKLISKRYSDVKSADGSLKEAYEQAHQQWGACLKKVGELSDQLQEVPAQWAKYNAKFEEISKWMDMVDSSLSGIMKEVTTLEEFEKERAVVQAICKDVDTKRSDMKSLVQTFDTLVFHASDEESVNEQKKLEDLIARYKNLIPVIELTMVKTEVHSKCHVHRKEVKEICSLLKAVKETSAAPAYPDSIESVKKMIQQQDTAVKYLDEQRPNIMTLIQRGKDLARDSHAPAFVQDEVEDLETAWKQTFAQAVEKLKKLKGTLKLWNNYKEQKEEILKLMEQAEAELKRITPGHDSRHVAADLQAKQDMSVALREATEEMLKKLRDSCAKLTSVTAPEKKPLLLKEVTEIERQLQVVLETVQERVVYLEKFNARWTTFQSRLEELKKWADTNGPQQLKAIESIEKSPLERMEKVKVLQQQIAEKMSILDALDNEARGILQDDTENAEAVSLCQDIAEIKNLVANLHKALELQSDTAEEALSSWQDYQGDLQKVKPWVERAEVKVNAGIAKPVSLIEAQQQLEDAKAFERECEEALQCLQTLEGKSQRVAAYSSVPDELNAVHSRWAVVHDVTMGWRTRAEALVDSWQTLEDAMGKMEAWLQAKESEVRAPLNLNCPDTKKLENKLAAFKALNKEVAEKQAQLMGIIQSSDNVAQALALEGSMALKAKVAELKSKVTALGDDVRHKINDVSDSIIARQEFQSKMADFDDYMDQLSANLSQLDDVSLEKIEPSRQVIHTLLQEHSDQQKTFNDIYSEVKKLTSSCTPEEASKLNDDYTELAEKYQELEDNIRDRKKALDRWSELLSWKNEANEQLMHTKYQLDSHTPSQDELKQFCTDLDGVSVKVESWKEEAPSIDKLSKQGKIQFRSETSGEPLTSALVVEEIEMLIITLNTLIKKKQNYLQDTSKRLTQFQETKENVLEFLGTTKDNLNHILESGHSLDKLDKVAVGISGLIEEYVVKAGLKEKLYEQGRKLMQDDPAQAPTIQNILVEVENTWENLHSDLKDRKAKFAEVCSEWRKFCDTKDSVCMGVNGAMNVCSQLMEEVPSDAMQVSANYEKLKGCLDILKKAKLSLDIMDTKGDAIMRTSEGMPMLKTEEVGKELSKAHELWQNAHDSLCKYIQNFETQLIIWRQIDETKDGLLPWISETIQSISTSQDNLVDAEAARSIVNKYKEELPSYANAKANIAYKTAELMKLNNGKQIPTLSALNDMLEEQFTQLGQVADSLDSLTQNVGEQEKIIRDDVKKFSDSLSKIREELMKCEDLTGDDAKVLKRIQKCQSLKVELQEWSPSFKELSSAVEDMKSQFPAFANSAASKELESIKKRFDAVSAQANTIELSLLSFLRKHHNEKFNTLQKLVSSFKEKTAWCRPEAGSDRYNLEAKLSSLQDVSMVINDCNSKMSELDCSLALLNNVESLEKMEELKGERDELAESLESLNNCYLEAKKVLEFNINLWQKYELMSENLSSWLREIEGKVRAETVNQVNLPEISDKMKEMNDLKKQVYDHDADITDLAKLGDEITRECSEARAGQYVGSLASRHQNIKKFISSYLDRLELMCKNQDLYKSSVVDVQKWLDDSISKLKSYEDELSGTGKAKLSYQKKLKEFSETFKQEKETGQALLNKAIEAGETLFPGVAPANREAIRGELRKLRGESESLLDQVNELHKKVEGRILQLSSFDDSHTQINQWMVEARSRIGGSVSLKPTLQEKKLALHEYKCAAQDIKTHQNILSQLQEKINALSDPEASSKFDHVFSEYKQLEECSQDRIATAEKYVLDHEMYLQHLDKLRDCLSTCRTEAAAVVEAPVEKEGASEKLAVIETLLQQRDQGNELLDTCKALLDIVLKGTEQSGHPPLMIEFEKQLDQWYTFLDQCTDTQKQLLQLCSKWTEFEETVEELATWLRQKETVMKDQSLRKDTEAKKAHLAKLKGLEDEILSKGDEFSQVIEQSKSCGAEGETELTAKVSQIATRYQALKNLAKEGISKYQNFAKEHSKFDEDYNDFSEWIAKSENELDSLCKVIGDFSALQERQKKLKELAELRAKEVPKFDTLVDLGEKLYVHTSPEGRETIRKLLRNLRSHWDNFGDSLQSNGVKLEHCLLQFSELSKSQEQLTKWLNDVELAMQKFNEIKSSLQEKKALLQNHKIMHQDIMSHQQLVESVCEKGQLLIDQTQDKSLNVYFQSIKQLFQNIVLKSKDLMDKLEGCVADHNHFNTACKTLKDWINAESDKLQECNDVIGEKSDIAKRLANVKTLKENQDQGNIYMSNVKDLFEVVSRSTSEKGIESLKKEVDELESKLKSFYGSVEDVERNLEESLNHWKEFEEQLEFHTKWIRVNEAVFRDQQLKANLEDKEEQLKSYLEKRDVITKREADVDAFVDRSHALLHRSEADRIKPLISQITSRYELLRVLSKEVVNHWQVLVDDHRAYNQRLQETEAWLTPLEDLLRLMKNGPEEGMASQQQQQDTMGLDARLRTLLAEKDQAPHKLEALNAAGKRLFPVTASQGREKIRHELRLIRERWEKLEEGLKEYQKQLDAQSLQWSSYQETLHQTLAWLEAAEKALHQEPSASASPQEARSRLLKHKTNLQEVLSHKRIIESLGEKAHALAQLRGTQVDIPKVSDQIGKRYEKLVNNYLVTITALEESLDATQQFQDLQKLFQDIQKQLWERLSSYSDYTGNVSALKSRLEKVIELDASKSEASNTLKSMGDLIVNRSEKLPQRTREAMERELANLRFEFEKFSTSVGDVRHNLEDRLQQWAEYDISFERLLAWLAETEATLKNYAPKSTLDEKDEQLEKYQSLIVSVQQNDADLDKLRDSSTELVQKSGESRISVNVQQITSRFQSIQVTAKEIMKKCEQSVADHQAYLKKYDDCSNWLSSMQQKLSSCLEGDSVVSHQDLQESIMGLRELLSDKPNAMMMLNSTVELGEKSYATTAIEGRETIRLQLQELQHAFESLFDSASSSERELQAKLLRWTGFEECSASIKQWLKEVEAQLPADIELKTTLDEKRAKLQTYRNLLHDVSNHQQDIINLRDKVDSLPEKNDKIEQLLKSISEQHQGILKRCQNFVEQYEAIVSDHQQYSKAVMDTQEWLEATHNTVLYWEDTDLERISLLANLERLKNLYASLPEEEHRIHQIRALGEKVIPGTVESGQVNIRSQIDSSQQEWEGLTSAIRSTIEAFESKLQQWNEYESLKDQCLAWIRDTDTKLHAVDLQPTLREKKEQLEMLKTLQGEVRAKELEIDAVTERAQQLYKGSISARSSQISELGLKYQQVSHKVKDLASRWNQYVSTHQEFDSRVEECTQWLQDIKNKLSYCSDLSASSQKDLEGKLETIQDSLLYKEEGFAKVQGIVELAQNVLANTAPSGHEPINQALIALQDEWSVLASRMVEIKANLDDSIQRWAGFLEQIHQLNKTVEYIEGVFNELSEYQTTMSEKRTQLERLKCLDEKARCEKIEVESLKSKAAEMLASGQQSLAASQAQEILNKFDTLVEKIKVLLVEREDQYRYHRLYKEAQDDLIAWVARAREKVPAMKQRSLSDKLAIESAVAPLEALLNKKAQGELLVEHLHHTGEVVLASTSPQGQEIIRNEIKALGESFEGLFKEIKQQKDQLETMVIQWKAYKEEFERLSDWLQQFDILVKAQKNALLPNLAEKNKQVNEVKEILQGLEKGQEQIDKFNKTASSLLTSHLETYVNNQLRHLNSRYQVQVNLAEDVMKKVETNRDQHAQYEDSLAKAKSWIENAKQVIRQSSEASSNSSKEVLQARLDQIQDLLNQREEAQNLIHMTINLGEKVVRNTRSDGKDIINAQLKEIQTDWDRIVRKISTSKVHLETSLLQWADYSSSYSQLQQWITDREAKLQQVCEQKISKAKKGQASGLSSLSIGERKATLRQTDSIVQDIVSFEPMIQSVTSRAEDLLQQQPASEISTKYETLSKQAKELYAKQKETVEQHQAFINAGNDFAQWIRAARERLGKCSEPTGDKETLSNKVSQLTVLQSEIPEGQQKLEKALEQGNVACQVADTEDKEIIEEEVALLQEEFDNYIESLSHTKSLLEIGIVKWTEYEDQYQESIDWLTQTEVLVHSYNKLQDSLEEKKNFLEQFQNHLQTLFDWQRDLDRLNMKAQVLLETCSDTRISNAITQMTTKYNALLSLAKEIMKRLELHYQEHQQHNTLYQECQDWLDRTKEKLSECQEVPNTLPEVKNKLQVVRGIRQTLEQGQNKLRYALELKEKVILNTEQNGAAKLQEDTDNLKQEFEKLMTDVQDVRQKLTNRASQLEEIHKAHKLLADWLVEIDMKVKSDEGDLLNDLSEKRATLEKFRTIQRDVLSQKDPVERIRARIAGDKIVLAGEYKETLNKYDNLQNLVSNKIEVLEKQVKEHGDYKQVLNDAIDWVRKTRIDIQHNSDPHGEKEQTVNKDKRITEILATLPEGEKLLSRVFELSETVMDTTGAEGKDTIKQEVRQLKSDWESLNGILRDSQKMLAKCLSAWNDFASTSQKMKDWLGDFEKRVDSETRGENKSTDNLQCCRALLLEALQHKPLMEELNDRCEVLMELSACSWVRDQSVQLQGSYTNLLTTVQGLVSRVEKNLSDLTEFIKAKEEFDTWLKRAHGTVQDCIGVGDEESAKDKLETIRLVSTRMSEGQHLMTALQDVFAKAVNNTPGDQQDTIREDMAYLHNSWDQLTMDVNSTMAQLKAAKNRWQDFNEAKAAFESWLKGVEATLQKTTDTKAELGEMKTYIERFKHMQEEVNSKRSDIDHLTSEAAELSTWTSKPSLLEEEVKRLYLRWEQLPGQCNARRENHEIEMQEYLAYHQSLQDTEKWILQVSFQLMAHNSLYITNKQQTQEQISQHEALLEDIQKYQTTLDDLKAKGHGQIERYEVTTPTIRETITTQLNNVQDSYKSLLSTAVQIKNRLLESLAKFQEYEDTLESIMQNLDSYEPIIMEEVESPIVDLPKAQRQLENIRGLHNKLQAEKARLATAVQACEAAAACISRPSSPQDTVPAPIPDEELAVRSRLEDIIDQVQNRMALLTTTIGQLEEKVRQRGSLGKWLLDQNASVTEWASRPSKLRPEAAKAELQQMNELLADLGEKKTQMAELLSSPEEKDAELEGKLSQLEGDLKGVIAKKQQAQGKIEDYRNRAHDLSVWFDQLLKEMEALEKGSGLDCSQKLAAIKNISNKFDAGGSKMEDLKDKANFVINEVSNLDLQQVEDQVKSLERRHNDIQKRIHRKAQVLDKTKKGFDSAQQDIGDLGNWVNEVRGQVRSFPMLGYERKPAEERQQFVKGLAKDAEGKQVSLQSLEKRISNMQTELENPELQSLENSLKSVSSSHSDLQSVLEEEMDKVSAALESRKRFEKALDDVKKWLKSKSAELNKLGAKTPLLSSVVDQDISLCRAFENEVKNFGDSNLNDLNKQASSLLKECEEPVKKQLNSVTGDVNGKYEKLKNGIGKKLLSLEDLLRKRKDFEDKVENVKHWLNEADIATSAEIRDSTSELLEEQLAKYDKLCQESAQMKVAIDEIFDIGKSFDPTLSEADKFTLMEDLSSIKDKYTRIAGRINDKVNGLKDTIGKCKEVANKIAESASFMEGLQKEIKDLNRPVGSKVEDVESLLSAYEKILRDLKAYKSKLEDAGNTNIGELQNILKKQEDLIHMIEGQIAKLRQQLLLREQYIALITEIISFITKYNEIVREIERSGYSVEEKIKRYSDVILRIQECEGLLASASDKGQQIVDEGATAADRNSVTQQLQSLKQQLGALRREVEKRRGEHEATAAEHRKLLSELEEALDDLHQKESTAGSLPLLQRDPASVLEEIEQNEVLVRDVGQRLDKVRAILESVRHDEGLPGPLTERLSEASVLLSTLPRALEERSAYLKVNRQYRQEYGTLAKQLHDWIREAEDRLQKGKDGVDFENILTDLEEHKVFFGGESAILELAQQKLQKSADQIWPSLSASEQEELSREQQHHTQLLKNTLNSARSHRAELEQDAEIWKDYLQTMDRVGSILGRSQFSDEPAATLAGLQFNIQKIKHALNEVESQQSELDLLNERAREITRQSDPFNCEKVKHQIQNVNRDWNELVRDLESRRDTLSNLSSQWKEFETKWQDFESFLVTYEEKARHVDTIVRNKTHIEEAKASLHDILEEVEGHKSAHEEVLFLSGSVLTYLSAFAEPASASLKEKLDKLTKSYTSLADSLNKKLEKVKGDIKYFESLEEEIKKLQESLTGVHSDIAGFLVFDKNQDNPEAILQALSDRVDTLVAKAKLLNSDSKEKYISAQKLVPTDIAQLLSELELLAETVHTAMDDKKQEFKKARTVRYEYDKDVASIQEWIQRAESKIQDRSVQPLKLKEYLQEIQSGIGDVDDKLERAKKNGSLISENSNCEKERELINKTLITLTEDLQQVKSWLEDKKHKVGDSLDSWERFMQLYKEICSWAVEKRKFCDEPLYLNNITVARKKLQDYSVAAKTAKQMSRNIADMSKELDSIRAVTTVEDLPEKLEEATELKGDVESLLIDKNTLLQELTEEWEQYEKKLKDVKAFMEKSKLSLESPQNKKRPLRDQLSLREKILSEIAIQRKKITISVEKLQVHFRSIAVGETNVNETVDDLMKELDQLQARVKEQNVTLENCLAQVDECLQEIQSLQQQIAPVEQQLRVVLSPTYCPNEKERALAEQNACRERIKALQTKITARNERIKLLVQRGTPDSEPLDS